MFLKIGVGPPNHPFVNRVFHYFHHPFRATPIFGKTHVLPWHLSILPRHPLASDNFTPWRVTRAAKPKAFEAVPGGCWSQRWCLQVTLESCFFMLYPLVN